MISEFLSKSTLAKSACGATATRRKGKCDVNPLSRRTAWRVVRQLAGAAACGVILAAVAAPQARGQGGLVHRYSFTSNANDSVGTDHGTVIDAGVTPNFSFTGGQLNFTANSGNLSNNITEDAYLDLPNGIVSAAATSGMNGAVAFEWWYTLSESRTWQRVGDFGNSNDGENTSNLGSASPYLSIVATSGRGNQVDMTNHTTTGFEPAVGLGGAATIGTPYHVMAVYNHNNHRSFTPQGSNGTMTLYVNGALVGYGAIHPDIDIRTFADVNNWLGRSQWPDPLFDGSYDEFRIYNAAPSDAYVASSFALGPDAVPVFTPWVEEFDLSFEVDRDTGTFTLSNSAAAIDVVGINIQSASGALDPTKWRSVADNFDADSGVPAEKFDPDNTWTITFSTPTQLNDVELSGDGGQLGTGGTQTSLPLGSVGAWRLSRFEDLVVTIDRLLPDLTVETIGVPVSYEGGLGAPAARSDLNFDGQVNAADWVEFASHHLENLSGMTVAQAAALGDLDGNLTNDYDDFIIFEADFDAANGGPGALAALIAGVPEPSSLVMLAVGCGAAGWRRRLFRRRGKVILNPLGADSMISHPLISSGVRSAFVVAAMGVLLAGSPAGAQLVPVISDDFESYPVDTPDTPVAPYAFGDPSNISAIVRSGVGVGGSQALEIQFDMTEGVTINTGLRYPRPTANATTSNLAKYMLSFDMALVTGGTTGFFSSPKLELFSNNGINASGFVINDDLLTPGGGYQHYSYLLSEASEITFGHTQHVDPTVPTLDVAFVFLGFPAGATQHQTYLIDNLKIEIAPAPQVDLTLVVDKISGEMFIRNESANPVSFDYYSIESGMGALDPGGWNSLDDKNYDFSLTGDFTDNGVVNGADFNDPAQGFKARFGNNQANNLTGSDFLDWQRNFGRTAGPADSWIEAGGSSTTVLSELFLNGATTLAPGQQVSLGFAYDKSVFGANNGDLVFNVSTAESTALGIGQVRYEPPAVPAASNVPEPATMVYCLAAIAAMVCKRR